MFFEWYFIVFANLYGQGSQTSVLSARGSLRGETIVVKKKLLYPQIVSRFEQETFGLLATTVRQRCQNCTLYASGTNWGKNCFENLCKALTTLGLQSRSFRSLGGNISQFRQFCILCVQRNVLDQKIFFIEVFLKTVSGRWAKTIQTFGANFLGTVSRTAITSPYQHLHEYHFLSKIVFYIFFSFRRNFFQALENFLRQSWQNFIFQVHRNFSWETVFEKV